MDTYEKKYNEAKKRAIEQLSSTPMDKVALHYIFPELHESEDERMYEAIISLLKEFKNSGTLWLKPTVQLDNAISFLEKQKDQHIPWYDYQKSKEAGYTIVPNEEYEQLIKQKEHKPVECSEVELEFRGEKVTVKRPFYRDDKGRGYSTAELDEGVAWNALRAWCEKKGISLYDLYPKAEWSEEDEKMLNRIIETLSLPPIYDTKACAKMVSFLKSLRPSWKPSKEQMEALWDAYKGGKEQEPLRELIEQLKKL